MDHGEQRKKSGGKGKSTGKRAAKDLAPRKTRDVKGGFASSVQKKNDDTVAGQIQKIG